RAAVLPVTRPAPEPHMAASTSSSKRDTRRGDSGGAGGGSQDAPGDSRGARPRLTARGEIAVVSRQAARAAGGETLPCGQHDDVLDESPPALRGRRRRAVPSLSAP